MALGDDLSTAWSRPDATAETRKAILRAVLEEIVVTLADGCVDLLLHWRGGDHTRLSVPRNRTGQHRWAASADGGQPGSRTGEAAAGTARSRPRSTASARRPGEATPGRKPGCAPSAIAVALPSSDQARWRCGGELTLTDAATRLGISNMTVLRLIAGGTIDATQVCKGGPWAIPEAQVDTLHGTNLHPARPLTGSRPSR